jgi:hypothetical protein
LVKPETIDREVLRSVSSKRRCLPVAPSGDVKQKINTGIPSKVGLSC